MRIVTYARVSSIGQETEGQSLQNQERAFARAIEARGWLRVRAYREAASAGTVEGRAEFTRMIAELPNTRPEAIVVDTLDRFTRNLREGLHLLEQLRGHGVGLLPLDWRREKPIDVDDDRDWSDVVEEFTAAERERRKIRRRIVRSYEGRRERGATTTNRPPFGLTRVGDALVPDPARAWIAQEADQRVLRGEAYGEIAAWARTIDPGAWKTRTGVALAVRNRSYVDAGVRTEETQAQLDAHLAMFNSRFGHSGRRHEHEFAGVFVCGTCVDLGYAPARSIMHGSFQAGVERVVCDRSAHAQPRGHVISISAPRIAAGWRAYLAELAADAALVDRWAHGGGPTADRRMIERRLVTLDQRAAALRERRDAALDLATDPDPGIRRQVRKMLSEVDEDDAAIAAAREALLGELAATERPRRDPTRVRTLLARLGEIYEKARPKDRNALSRALCAALGGRPELRRLSAATKGGPSPDYRVALTWPVVDELAERTPVSSTKR